jgi:hypothetical protein
MDDNPHGSPAEHPDSGHGPGLTKPGLDGILKFLRLKEEIAITSTTHHEQCACDICMAAFGDKEAFYRMWLLDDD